MYRNRGALGAASWLLLAACATQGCADEEGGPEQVLSPGVTADASVDAGSLPLDAGWLPIDAALVDAAVVAVDAASADAGAASSDASGDAAPTPEDLGEGDGKDVITIGDSWMNLSPTSGIEISLEKVSKRDYRNFGVSGTKLLDEVIPNQYKKAKTQDPDIKTVIMTGGGNDIIQVKALDCAAFNDACKAQIDAVGARLVKLWDEMSKDGVRDVVIVGYTRKANLAGVSLAKSAEYSNEKIPPLCAAVAPPLRCHSLDSDMFFDGTTREGIHPLDAGYDAIGKAVWELMQKEGMRR